jgi:hypothetical protein
MVNALLQKEIKVLKERQGRLERLFYSLLGSKVIGEDEEIRPSYLRKIERISKRMDQGHGIVKVRTRRELEKFLNGL